MVGRPGGATPPWGPAKGIKSLWNPFLPHGKEGRFIYLDYTIRIKR